MQQRWRSPVVSVLRSAAPRGAAGAGDVLLDGWLRLEFRVWEGSVCGNQLLELRLGPGCGALLPGCTF